MKSSAPRPPRAAAGHGGNPILLAIAISIASCHTVATAAATGTGASRRPTPQLSVTAVYMEQSKGVFSVNTYRAPAHGQDGAPMALANVTAWRRPSCSLGGRIAFGPWFKNKIQLRLGTILCHEARTGSASWVCICHTRLRKQKTACWAQATAAAACDPSIPSCRISFGTGTHSPDGRTLAVFAMGMFPRGQARRSAVHSCRRRPPWQLAACPFLAFFFVISLNGSLSLALLPV